VWARGQLALARLASARSDTAIVLADLDQLAVEAEIAAVDQPTIDAQTIAGARDSVVARIAEEDAALARLQG
jgi:Meckel syndrome type 1 protein